METRAKKARRPFFMCPSKVYDWGLSKNAMAVYIFLHKMADNEDRTSHPGKKYIAANCKISLSSVHRAMRELMAVGLVTSAARFSEGHQKSNTYTVYDNLGEAFEESPENSAFAGQTSVPPPCHGDTPTPATVTHLPLPHGHPYPCHGDSPTPATVTGRTIISELESFELEGGGTKGSKAPPQQKQKYGDDFGMVEMTAAEYAQLKEVVGSKVAIDYVKRLDAHLASTGKKYSSHYATIYKWVNEDNRKKEAKPTAKQNRFANFKQRNYSPKDWAEFERLQREHNNAALAAIEDGQPKV